MKQIKCKKCGKIIEGYTENQVEYLLKQHDLAKHQKVDKDANNK